MDGVHQRGDMVGRRRRNDAVAEVEDVSRSGSRGVEQGACPSRDRFRIRQQDHWIEIALERDAIADPPPRRSQIHRPVNANTLGAAVRKFLEPGPATFGEENGRYAAWREKWKRVEHRTHRSERETTPFRGGEQAPP